MKFICRLPREESLPPALFQQSNLWCASAELFPGTSPRIPNMTSEASNSESSGCGSRAITALLGVLFFLPVSLHLHNHFDLPVSAEIFAGATIVFVFVLLLFFQSEKEGRMSKKTR